MKKALLGGSLRVVHQELPRGGPFQCCTLCRLHCLRGEPRARLARRAGDLGSRPDPVRCLARRQANAAGDLHADSLPRRARLLEQPQLGRARDEHELAAGDEIRGRLRHRSAEHEPPGGAHLARHLVARARDLEGRRARVDEDGVLVDRGHADARRAAAEGAGRSELAQGQILRGVAPGTAGSSSSAVSRRRSVNARMAAPGGASTLEANEGILPCSGIAAGVVRFRQRRQLSLPFWRPGRPCSSARLAPQAAIKVLSRFRGRAAGST